jgi:hypothetical protein
MDRHCKLLPLEAISKPSSFCLVVEHEWIAIPEIMAPRYK